MHFSPSIGLRARNQNYCLWPASVVVGVVVVVVDSVLLEGEIAVLLRARLACGMMRLLLLLLLPLSPICGQIWIGFTQLMSMNYSLMVKMVEIYRLDSVNQRVVWEHVRLMHIVLIALWRLKLLLIITSNARAMECNPTSTLICLTKNIWEVEGLEIAILRPIRNFHADVIVKLNQSVAGLNWSGKWIRVDSSSLR